MVSDEEAKDLLSNMVSEYQANAIIKGIGVIAYDESIPEMLSLHYTNSDEYSTEFVKLLKKSMKGGVKDDQAGLFLERQREEILAL